MASSPVDASRRRQEKRRQLDARRSKCRIRLGGHMEQWCLLKERLGFSLHSQLAKFLLDRLGAPKPVSCPNTARRSWCPEPRSGQEPAGRPQKRRVEKREGKWFPSL
uniref:Zinc finger protein 692 n=1 Tax=Ursus americanus TaxID=9643 RepID=A0A452QYD8_URSAM